MSAPTEVEPEWCGQCYTLNGEGWTDHATNRCPVGADVRCLTHERWMKRGDSNCGHNCGGALGACRPGS